MKTRTQNILSFVQFIVLIIYIVAPINEAGIIIPFFMEQAFWAERIAGLGAGFGPLPRWRLTSARLAEAIQTVLHDQDMRERAAALGRRLQAEDGIGQAVQIFHDSLLRS